MMKNEFEKIIEFSKENKKIFDELLGLCINGLIVPYVGAGMSAFAFPLWSNYIKKLCLQIGYNLGTSNNIDAAEIIKEKMGKSELYKVCNSANSYNLFLYTQRVVGRRVTEYNTD